jgi:cytochrome c-type biogenesis protein CcmH
MSDQEIKDYYVEKYGLYILANPPKNGFDSLVFIAPLLFGLLGLIILYKYLFS